MKYMKKKLNKYDKLYNSILFQVCFLHPCSAGPCFLMCVLFYSRVSFI